MWKWLWRRTGDVKLFDASNVESALFGNEKWMEKRIKRTFCNQSSYMESIKHQIKNIFPFLSSNSFRLFGGWRPSDTQKTGSRVKCAACHIIAHTNCLSIVEQSQLACKPSFTDVGVRDYRENRTTKHHWIHRRTEKGKCSKCGKVNENEWKKCLV